MRRLAFLLALLVLAAAQPSPSGNATAVASAKKTDSATEALRIFGVVALILCGAMFSGLTLGLMSLDTNQLQVREFPRVLLRQFHFACDGCVRRAPGSCKCVCGLYSTM